MKNCKYKGQPGSHCNGHGQSCPYFNKNYWCQAYRKSDDYIRKIAYIVIFLIIIAAIIFSADFVSIVFGKSAGSNIIIQPTNLTSNSQQSPIKQLPTSIPQQPLTQPLISSLSNTALDSQNYETGLISKSYSYVLRGKSDTINLNLYKGIFDEILAKPAPVWCTRYNYDTSPCTSEETRQYNLKYLDDPIPKKYLDNLVSSIKAKTSNNDDRARIAISLVQQIPYDNSRLYLKDFRQRSPYEVLYENKGVCGEKSKLLAYLLRELGYSVVLFEFSSENHMAVGIKSPVQYSYKNSGYAFIEAASPTIPTDSESDYIGAGKLKSTPEVIKICDGSMFSSISEEYQDSVAFNQLGTGTTLSPEKYRQWELLMWKYGLKTSDGTTISENPSNKPLCDNDGILCNGECYDKCGSHMIGKCTANGVICEGDPNNCPSGQIACNGQCYPKCSGSTPKCESRGLVCYY